MVRVRVRVRGLVVVALATFQKATTALTTLRTKTRISNSQQADVYDFIATPSHWPQFVLSSWYVDGATLDAPLCQGESVKEVFGLPPILPLTVDWTCVQSDMGLLDVRAPDGIPGHASDCRMLLNIQQDESDVTVDLTVEYEPQSILGQVAAPVMTIDNALALRLFLPSKFAARHGLPLDEFRNIMGTLYGFAGVAHYLDCVAGPSQLLMAAGCPSFYALPAAGQVLVLIWCAVGPLSYLLSKRGQGDLGLCIYGSVEVFSAALATWVYSPPFANMMLDAMPLQNAVLVQGIVALAWLYSRSKKPLSPMT